MARSVDLLPNNLRFRVRLAVFVPVLASLTLTASGPLSAILATPYVSSLALLAASAGVLALVVVLVALADGVARVAAHLAVRDLDRLGADVRRATAAESRDRRGEAFLAAKAEVAEVARVRGETRALVEACRRRREADHTVLGAAIHDVKAGLAGLGHILDAGPHGATGVVHPSGDLVVVARDEARRLLEVMSTMIAFLRSSRDDVPRSGDVDLSELVQRIVTACRRQGADTKLVIEVRGAVIVRGDATLLSQALGNLVENAARMARSYVTVSVFPGVVRVEDDGPGLPGDLARLGTAFVTSDTVSVRGEPRRGSLGLGLYIAQRVLEAHDGGLTVERSDSSGTVLLAYVGRAS